MPLNLSAEFCYFSYLFKDLVDGLVIVKEIIQAQKKKLALDMPKGAIY